MTSTHEDLDRPQGPSAGSDRAFGLLFAAVFAVVALFPLLESRPPRWWALTLGLAFLAAAAVRPQLLAYLNRAWALLGRTLHRIVSPVFLGLLFLVAVVPTSLYLRLSGKDPLRLKYDRKAATYWQDRSPPGPPAGSLKNQF